MGYEFNVQVKKGLFGFSEEERTRVIIRPADRTDISVSFFLGEDLVQVPTIPSGGKLVRIEDIEFVRDALDFISSLNLIKKHNTQ